MYECVCGGGGEGALICLLVSICVCVCVCVLTGTPMGQHNESSPFNSATKVYGSLQCHADGAISTETQGQGKFFTLSNPISLKL